METLKQVTLKLDPRVLDEVERIREKIGSRYVKRNTIINKVLLNYFARFGYDPVMEALDFFVFK